MFNEVVIPLSFIFFTLNLKHSALNKNSAGRQYCRPAMLYSVDY